MTQLYRKFRNNQNFHEEFTDGTIDELICHINPGQKGSEAAWVAKQDIQRDLVLGSKLITRDGAQVRVATWLPPKSAGEICRWNVGSPIVSGQAGYFSTEFVPIAGWGPHQGVPTNPNAGGAWYNNGIGVLSASRNPQNGTFPNTTTGMIFRLTGTGSSRDEIRNGTIEGSITLNNDFPNYRDLAINSPGAMQAVFGNGGIPIFNSNLSWTLSARGTGFQHHATPASGTFPTAPANNTYRLALVGNGTPTDREITGIYVQIENGAFALNSAAAMAEVFGNAVIDSGEGQFILYEAAEGDLTATFSGTQNQNVQRGTTTNLGAIQVMGGRPPYTITTGNTAGGSVNGTALLMAPPSNAPLQVENIRVDVADSATPPGSAPVNVAVNVVDDEALTLTLTETVPEYINEGELTVVGTASATGGTGNITFSVSATNGTVSLAGERGARNIQLIYPVGEDWRETTISVTATDSGTPQPQTVTEAFTIEFGALPLHAEHTIAATQSFAVNAPGENRQVVLGILTLLSGGVPPYVETTSTLPGTFTELYLFGDTSTLVYQFGNAAVGTVQTGDIVFADDVGNEVRVPVSITITAGLAVTSTVPVPPMTIDVKRGETKELGTLEITSGDPPFSSSAEGVNSDRLTISPTGTTRSVFYAAPDDADLGAQPAIQMKLVETGTTNEWEQSVIVNIIPAEELKLIGKSILVGSPIPINPAISAAFGLLEASGGTKPYTFSSNLTDVEFWQTNTQPPSNVIGIPGEAQTNTSAVAFWRGNETQVAGIHSPVLTVTDSAFPPASESITFTNAIEVFPHISASFVSTNPHDLLVNPGFVDDEDRFYYLGRVDVRIMASGGISADPNNHEGYRVTDIFILKSSNGEFNVSFPIGDSTNLLSILADINQNVFDGRNTSFTNNKSFRLNVWNDQHVPIPNGSVDTLIVRVGLKNPNKNIPSQSVNLKLQVRYPNPIPPPA